MIGQSVGHYRITAKLGAGGMGEVYRAKDTRLGRDVALKLLPEMFAKDEQRMARFSREAQVLASLNHPNIAQIYGIESLPGAGYREDGQQSPVPSLQPPTSDPTPQTPDPRPQSINCLVMELVEGEDLSERIARAPIPLDEALPIALQIAEALEDAHEKGIIHRDLKPANIKLTPEGKVKVLDFGLAKAMEGPVDGQRSTVDGLSQSPTLSMAATQAGIILGTAAYMSPEQAKGRPVDRRADIWAFGIVLYEMLTGKQAFQGEDITEVLANVITKEPDWSTLPTATPPPIQKLISRCLRKDAQQRLRDIGDARLEIEEGLHFTAEAIVAHRPTRTFPGWAWTATGVLAGALLAWLAAWSLQSEPTPARQDRLAIPLPVSRPPETASGLSTLTLSPDGTNLVYVGRSGDASQLFLRPMNRFESKPIAGTDGAYGPVFSPDGQWVAFFADGQLKKAAITGGPVTTLAEAPQGLGASWGFDDSIVYCPDQWGLGLWRVSASGGVAEALTRPDPETGESLHALPHHLPGGDVILFASFKGPSPTNAFLEALDLHSGQRRVLVQGSTHARYVPPGRLVYASGGALLTAPFDRAELVVTGPGLPVLEGVLNSSRTGSAHFSVADQGALVYLPTNTLHDERSLVAVDRSGVARPLTDARHPYEDMALSPDGRHLALTIEGPSWGIWVLDLERRTLTRLTLENDNRDPHWTPDGQRVVYTSFRNGHYGIYEKSADGSGPEEQLTMGEYQQSPESWSPDGHAMAFSRWSPETQTDIWILPRLDGFANEPRLLVATRFNDGGVAFSPDGGWLAYESSESGRLEVYVQPYPGPGGRLQVSTDGGDTAVWAADGRELFYRNGNKMMVVPIEREPSFKAGSPRVLFEGHYINTGHDYDVSFSGDRFYLIQEGPAPTEIRVIQNWLR